MRAAADLVQSTWRAQANQRLSHRIALLHGGGGARAVVRQVSAGSPGEKGIRGVGAAKMLEDLAFAHIFLHSVSNRIG